MAAARPLLKLLFLASLVAVVYLCLAPPGAAPSISFLSDKLQHASAYGWLGLVGSLAMQSRRARIGVVTLLPVMGVAIELLQFLVPGRTPEVADALANLIGTLLGAGVYWLFERMRSGGRTRAT